MKENDKLLSLWGNYKLLRVKENDKLLSVCAEHPAGGLGKSLASSPLPEPYFVRSRLATGRQTAGPHGEAVAYEALIVRAARRPGSVLTGDPLSLTAVLLHAQSRRHNVILPSTSTENLA